MTSFVDKICTIRQTSTRYYFLNWVFKYVKLNSKVVNIIQCLHGQQLYSFINPICTAFFMLCTATCFFAHVDSRYYTITNHLTQIFIIFMCATVNVKTLLTDFFYLCICTYQLSSSLSGHKFCFVFLCTCVSRSVSSHNTYTKILSDYRSKNVRAYRICKFVHGSYH